MSNDNEEQLMECEALQSIYPTEFTVISDKVPREYTLDVSHTNKNNIVYTVQLHIHVPAEYPSKDACTVIVHSIEGISNDACTILQNDLNEQVNELSAQNSVAIFVVAQYTQDWLTDYKAEPQKSVPNTVETPQVTQIKQPSPLGIEAGTIVTMDSFRAWKALFAAEQAALQAQNEAARVKEHRITGKQLFMQNLVTETDDMDADDGVDVDYSKHKENVVDTVDTSNINASLFDDDDDLDDDNHT